MMHRGKNWAFYLGRDYELDYSMKFSVASGFIDGSAPNEIPWRHHWTFRWNWLPNIVFRRYRSGLVMIVGFGHWRREFRILK